MTSKSRTCVSFDGVVEPRQSAISWFVGLRRTDSPAADDERRVGNRDVESVEDILDIRVLGPRSIDVTDTVAGEELLVRTSLTYGSSRPARTSPKPVRVT